MRAGEFYLHCIRRNIWNDMGGGGDVGAGTFGKNVTRCNPRMSVNMSNTFCLFFSICNKCNKYKTNYSGIKIE